MQNHTHHAPSACCAAGRPAADHTAPIASHAAHGHHGADTPLSLPSLATSATVHCLTGCAIGELAGLAIGVTLGLGPWLTIALATSLGFASGYALGLWPLVRRGMTWRGAFRAIWLGETISIGMMELAMNFTDYHVGGIHAASLAEPVFWAGYAAAVAAGFVAAWPVNYWLLKRNIKDACH